MYRSKVNEDWKLSSKFFQQNTISICFSSSVLNSSGDGLRFFIGLGSGDLPLLGDLDLSLNSSSDSYNWKKFYADVNK
jgi:hypothetical protein